MEQPITQNNNEESLDESKKTSSSRRPQATSRAIPFPVLHAQFRGALVSKATKEIPQIPPGVWNLPQEQLQIASYESLLFATNLLRDISEKEVILNDIRPQLNISSKLQKAIWNIFQGSFSNKAVEFLCSVDFRLEILKNRFSSNSSEETIESATSFRERNSSIFFNGILNMILEAEKKYIVVENKQMDAVELLDNTKNLLTRLIDESQESEYILSVQFIELYFNSAKNEIFNGNKTIHYSHSQCENMYESLLATCFDYSDGSILPSRGDIIDVLAVFRKHYNISENEHEISYTKELFRVYSAFSSSAILQKELRVQIWKLHSLKLNSAEHSYRTSILSDIENWSKEKLCDYTKCASYVHLLFGVYEECLRTKDPDYMQAFVEDIASMIQASEYKQYERLAKRPFTVDSFAQFVDVLVLEVKEQIKITLPQLLIYGKLPFMKEFARLYNNEVKHTFKLIVNLNLQTAELQTKMHHLELAFLNAGIDQFELPNLLDLFSPLDLTVTVTTFISDQEQIFGTFASRALDLETWEPVNKTHRHSSSVVDVFAMIAQMSPVLFSLSLPALSEFFIGTMGGSINRTISKYVEVLLTCTKLRREILPISANERIKGKQQSKFVSYITKKEPIPPIPPQVVSKLSTQKTEQLCIRLNNIHFAIQQLKALKIELKTKAEQNKIPITPTYWDNMFLSSERLLERSAQELARYIGTKTVFFDLRIPFIESIYIPNPETGPRIEYVLSPLDPILTNICATVVDEYANDVALWIFKSCLEAFQYVLFYGGKERIFEPKHAEMFTKDLLNLQSFFIAVDEKGEAQGIPKQPAQTASNYLKSLLENILPYSTEFIIDQYDAATDSMFPPLEKTIFTKQNLLTTLIHRDDKLAKQFVNLQHGTPVYKMIKRGAVVFQDKPLS